MRRVDPDKIINLALAIAALSASLVMAILTVCLIVAIIKGGMR